MASAQVTVKLEPHELQIVDLALEVLGQVLADVVYGKPPLAKYNLPLDLADGDPRRLAIQTNEVKRGLGLR